MSDTIKLGPGQAREFSNTPDFAEASIEGIAAAGGVSYSTARVHLVKLENRGLIAARSVKSNGKAFFSKTEAGRAIVRVEVKGVNNSLAGVSA